MDQEELVQQRSCANKLIISLDNHYYATWQIFIGFLSVVTVISYFYFGAFGFPYSIGDTQTMVWASFEALFLVDIILNFF